MKYLLLLLLLWSIVVVINGRVKVVKLLVVDNVIVVRRELVDGAVISSVNNDPLFTGPVKADPVLNTSGRSTQKKPSPRRTE